MTPDTPAWIRETAEALFSNDDLIGAAECLLDGCDGCEANEAAIDAIQSTLQLVVYRARRDTIAAVERLIEQERRHVDLSPGVGHECMTYADGCYVDLLNAVDDLKPEEQK